MSARTLNVRRFLEAWKALNARLERRIPRTDNKSSRCTRSWHIFHRWIERDWLGNIWTQTKLTNARSIHYSNPSLIRCRGLRKEEDERWIWMKSTAKSGESRDESVVWVPKKGWKARGEGRVVGRKVVRKTRRGGRWNPRLSRWTGMSCHHAAMFPSCILPCPTRSLFRREKNLSARNNTWHHLPQWLSPSFLLSFSTVFAARLKVHSHLAAVCHRSFEPHPRGQIDAALIHRANTVVS